MIKAFPKIFAIGTDYIKDIFDGHVEITEKIDGSQFCFGKDNEGNFYMRSKGRQIYLETVDKMFSGAVNYALSVQSIVPSGFIFYCEYLSKPKHNSLKYNTIPKNGLYLFGISDYLGSIMCKTDVIIEWSHRLNIDPPYILYTGNVNSIEQIKEYLDLESYLKDTSIEGFVVKNYSKQFLLGGQPIPVMAGKYVSEAFKEKSSNWKNEHTNVGKFQAFKESYCTEARWLKAVQHIRDNGELLNDPKDIGRLIKEVQSDIIEEDIEEIKSFLWKEFGQEVIRYSTRGLPEWYKNQLANRSFK